MFCVLLRYIQNPAVNALRDSDLGTLALNDGIELQLLVALRVRAVFPFLTAARGMFADLHIVRHASHAPQLACAPACRLKRDAR